MNKSTDLLSSVEPRYVAPGWFTDRIFNRAVRTLTRWGLPLAGSRVLIVAGRRSGVDRATVVNVLDVGGERFLVAPRGTTDWVRNIRVASSATLRVGRRVETITVDEVADEHKVPVLRAYLERWGWEVGQFFEGVDRHATDHDLEAIAPGFPVFRIRAT